MEQRENLLDGKPITINFQGMSGGQIENQNNALVVYGGQGNTIVHQANPLDIITGNFKRRMKTINMDLHVSTKTERSAKRMLETSRCILITGKLGTGKTTIGLRMLSQVGQQKGRQPIVLDSPGQTDLLSLNDTVGEKGQECIVLIDDIFGNPKYVESERKEWEKQFEKMWPCIKSGRIHLVMTSRHDIYLQCDKLVGKYAIFKHAEKVCLDDDKYALSFDEMKRLVKKYGGSHFSKSQLSDIADARGEYVFGFPLCCMLFSEHMSAQKGTATSEHVSVQKAMAFFTNPRDAVVSEIKCLQQSDDFGFFTLLLVLTKKDNCLEIHLLVPPILKEFESFLERIRQFCNLDTSPSLNAIREKAEQLCGIYLVQSKIGFTFKHQSILDAFVLSIPRKYLNLFIQGCPVEIMLECVRLQSDSKDENDRFIYIPEDHYQSLAERLTTLIKNQKSSDILRHPAFTDKTFSNVLMKLWKGDMRTTLSLQLDEKPITRDTFNIRNMSQYRPFSDNYGLFDITHIFNYRCLLSHLIMNPSRVLLLFADPLMQTLKTMLPKEILMEALCCAIFVGSSRIAKALVLENEMLTFSCLRVLVISPQTDDSLLLQGFEHFILEPQQQEMLFSMALQFGNCQAVQWLKDNIERQREDHLSIFSDGLIQVLFQSSGEIRNKPQFVPSTSRKIRPMIDLLFQTRYTYDPTILLSLASGHDDNSALCYVFENVKDIDMHNHKSLHFHVACRYGSIKCFQKLLSRGINLDIAGIRSRPKPRPRQKTSVLPWQVPSVELQRSSSASPRSEMCTSPNRKYVHLALQSKVDTLEKVTHLTAATKKKTPNSAFINNSVDSRCKPLHYAAVRGNTKIVKHLLEDGAEVNCRDDWGLTPLMCALIGNKLDCAKMLRREGGHIFMKKQLLLHLISFFPDSEMPKSSWPPVIHYQIKQTKVNVDLLKQVFEKSHDERKYDADLHYSALLQSVLTGNEEALKFLLSIRVDVNRKIDLGQTVLHVAARKSLSVLKLICLNVADVNIVDDSGQTVLHEAVKSDVDVMDKIEYLLEVKAVSRTADRTGRTALFPAVERGDTDVVQYLADNGLTVNHCDMEGTSLLHVTCKINDGSTDSMLQTLFDLNIDVPHINKHGQTPIHFACKNGNLKLVQFLLSKDFSSLAKDNQGRSGLHLAAASGNVELVELIMKQKENFPYTDKDEKTPLHYAAQNNHVLLTHFFLLHFPNFNLKDSKGRTALLYAVLCLNVEVASAFIHRKLNIDDKDNCGISPLHAAVMVNSVVIVKQLLTAKVDISATNNKSQTALHLAVIYGFDDIVEPLLQSNIALNAKDNKGRSALHYSVSITRKSILHRLLEKGIDINLKDAAYETALHCSCLLQGAEIFKILVSAGADTNITEMNGRTVFHLAVLCDNSDIIRCLLEGSIYFLDSDNYGNTALHLAAAAGFVNTLQLLLKYITDVSIPNYHGKSPLHLAAAGNHGLCFELLKDHGANLTLRDKSGMTPAELKSKTCFHSRKSPLTSENVLHGNALQNKKDKFEESDKDDHKDCRSQKHQQTVQNKDYDLIKTFPKALLCIPNAEKRNNNTDFVKLSNGDSQRTWEVDDKTEENPVIGNASYSKPLSFEDSILFYFKYGNANQVRMQLRKADDISVTDNEGKSALHYAASRGESEILRILLLNHGRLASVKDKSGLTAVHIAAKHGRYEHMKLLISSGADVNVQDRSGLTPLHYATKLGDFDMVDLLLKNNSDPNITDICNETALHIARKTASDVAVEHLLSKRRVTLV